MALASAASYVAVTSLGLPPPVRVAAGILTSVTGRWIATSRDPDTLKHLLP